jgi:hypothetical protein
MKDEIKLAVIALNAQIKMDIWFFSFAGFSIGFVSFWQHSLKQAGWAKGQSWPFELFTDFVSVYAFMFIFLGVIIVSAISTIARRLRINMPTLELVVVHLESRLFQFASSMICFLIGFSAAFTTHWLSSPNMSDIVLLLGTSALVGILFCGSISASIVARRIKPFNKLVPCITMALAVLIAWAYLLVFGVSERL